MANPKLPIDELRTKCWLREVMLSLECEDVNLLSSLYEAESIRPEKQVPMGYQSLEIRWGDYELGKNRPTQHTLEAVESVFNVSANFYNNGPNNLLLWNSLWYQDTLQDLNKLQTIIDISKDLDAKIANLRVDVFLKRQSVHYLLDNLHTSKMQNVSNLEFASANLADIVDLLGMHLKQKASVEDVVNFLVEDIFIYSYPAYYAGLMESDRTYNPDYIEAVNLEMVSEEKYTNLRNDKPSRTI